MRFMWSLISVIIILYHVQATAGLRALGHEASENILQAVIFVVSTKIRLLFLCLTKNIILFEG